ncbi:hypothetical protein N7520_005478 [Penicillium odoratum]|uniref:uncharacterized protein n=1 Tax=Penicillium odoratum TaxID=1167516 RepID=UPI0025496BC8|nr:uncharacterized protein N7520_005478 [Penicillium odoratum]KAJ5765919.1 hypothetical protein N7520_005478 [Penicillium odoratum]
MEKSRDNEDFADQQGKKRKASHWSLVSLGFPVIVGTLCAMAIMFNICATAQGWQQTIHANAQTVKPSLPHWQVYFAWCLFFIQSQTKVFRNVALKALSLALASTAYILYLLEMAFHYTSRSGFTIAVFGWLASAIILLSLIGIEVQQHRNIRSEQPLEYTQNFYAGIFAASLYCLIAILLAAYMASSSSLHLSPTDRRTVECSSIIHRVITFTIILLGGAGIYSTIEGWSLMDALYFTDYTVLTIGIGNITPQTHLGRSLLFPYATAGIISLGFVISGVASFTNQVKNLKLRYAILEARRTFRTQDTEISMAEEEAQSTVPVPSKFPERDEVLELHRIKSKFYRRRRWQDLIFFSVAWFILWLISAEIFHRSEKSEHWTYFTALYFTYTSLTTIGYGDYHPTSNFGKAFFVFWSLLALPILTNLVTTMGEVLHRRVVQRCFPMINRFSKPGGMADVAGMPIDVKFAQIRTVDTHRRVEETLDGAQGVIWLAHQLAIILMVDMKYIEPEKPLTRYSFDGLLAWELCSWIFTDIHSGLSVFQLMSNGHIAKLTRQTSVKSK